MPLCRCTRSLFRGRGQQTNWRIKKSKFCRRLLVLSAGVQGHFFPVGRRWGFCCFAAQQKLNKVTFPLSLRKSTPSIHQFSRKQFVFNDAEQTRNMRSRVLRASPWSLNICNFAKVVEICANNPNSADVI